MKRLLLALPLLLAACAGGSSYRDTSAPIVTAMQVDLERYQGLWYEIARFPVSFEEGCVGVTAEYTLNPDNTVRVVNTCREGSLDAAPRSSEATAYAIDSTNAKLKVDFVPLIPFTAGDYWILDIDEAYRTVVVGNPDGTAGWILARQPQIDAARLQHGYDVLQAAGYDLSQITLTPQ